VGSCLEPDSPFSTGNHGNSASLARENNGLLKKHPFGSVDQSMRPEHDLKVFRNRSLTAGDAGAVDPETQRLNRIEGILKRDGRCFTSRCPGPPDRVRGFRCGKLCCPVIGESTVCTAGRHQIDATAQQYLEVARRPGDGYENRPSGVWFESDRCGWTPMFESVERRNRGQEGASQERFTLSHLVPVPRTSIEVTVPAQRANAFSICLTSDDVSSHPRIFCSTTPSRSSTAYAGTPVCSVNRNVTWLTPTIRFR
jgi:hypothetical protein